MAWPKELLTFSPESFCVRYLTKDKQMHCSLKETMSLSLWSLCSGKRRHGKSKQQQDHLSVKNPKGPYSCEWGKVGQSRQGGSLTRCWDARTMKTRDESLHSCKGPWEGPNQTLGIEKDRDSSTRREPSGQAKGKEIRQKGQRLCGALKARWKSLDFMLSITARQDGFKMGSDIKYVKKNYSSCCAA